MAASKYAKRLLFNADLSAKLVRTKESYQWSVYNALSRYESQWSKVEKPNTKDEKDASVLPPISQKASQTESNSVLNKDNSDEDDAVSNNKWKLELAWLTKALDPALQLWKWPLPIGNANGNNIQPGSRSFAEILASIQKSKLGVQNWSLSDLTIGLYLVYLQQASKNPFEDVKGVKISNDRVVQDLIYHVELAKGAYRDSAAGLAKNSMLRESNIVKFVRNSSLLRPHFRALITPHQRTISTSSSETLARTPNPEKTFFKPQNSELQDTLVKRLCRENKHEEAIINLCQRSHLTEAIQLLDRIEHPSSSIYSNLLQLCVQQRALEGTKRVHSHIKRSIFLLGVSSYNRIIDIYCKCGSLVDARNVFDEMPERDLCSWNTVVSGYAKAGRLKDARNLFDEMPERDNFSWTAIISGYVRHGFPNEALRLCRAMLKDYNVRCNKFTVCSALAASAATQCLTIGKEIHGHIVRTGIDSDAVVWSALSDMYGKCGSLDEARHIFDKTSDKDVTWTAMIDRYFKSGRREEGFLLLGVVKIRK